MDPGEPDFGLALPLPPPNRDTRPGRHRRCPRCCCRCWPRARQRRSPDPGPRRNAAAATGPGPPDGPPAPPPAVAAPGLARPWCSPCREGRAPRETSPRVAAGAACPTTTRTSPAETGTEARDRAPARHRRLASKKSPPPPPPRSSVIMAVTPARTVYVSFSAKKSLSCWPGRRRPARRGGSRPGHPAGLRRPPRPWRRLHRPAGHRGPRAPARSVPLAKSAAFSERFLTWLRSPPRPSAGWSRRRALKADRRVRGC